MRCSSGVIGLGSTVAATVVVTTAVITIVPAATAGNEGNPCGSESSQDVSSVHNLSNIPCHIKTPI